MSEAPRAPAVKPAPAAPGRRLAFGTWLLLASALLFAAIASAVASGQELTLVDTELAGWLHRHATPTLVTAMRVWTQLHSTVAISAYAAVAVLVLATERNWRRVTLVIVAVGGGLAINALVKLAFHRPRPAFDDPLLTLATYSFPSGHVAGSTIFYGLVVAAVFAHTRSPLRRALAVLGAALAIALVAFSRMLLGVHYLSDAVAAFAEGVAWLTLSIGALAAVWRETPGERRPEPT